MRIIELDQNSQQWLDWRLEGVGASESPCLLLDNHPWSTPYKLYCLKVGLLKPEPPNWAMKRGTELEPQVREWFIKHHFHVDPVCAEMADYPFIKASLDGYSKEQDAIVEIKVTGKNNHRLAKEGGVPEMYRIQMQHQMLVTGVSKCFYVSFLESEGDYTVVEELPDEKYQEQIFEACKAFWAKVVTKEPPELQERDSLVGDLTFNTILDKYLALEKAETSYRELRMQAKARLVDLATHDKVRGHNGVLIKDKQGDWFIKRVERDV